MKKSFKIALGIAVAILLILGGYVLGKNGREKGIPASANNDPSMTEVVTDTPQDNPAATDKANPPVTGKDTGNPRYSNSATSTPAPGPTPLPHISWTEEYYVDDFNDPTDETYMRGHFSGSFSNSATSGSDLNVYLYFDKILNGQSSDYFKIRLFEYGDSLVNFKYIDEAEVTVKIKIDGAVYEAHPDYLSEKDIYIKRSSTLFSQVISALNSGKEISVVITESQYSTSTYRFTIDSYGLNDSDHYWR